MESGFFKWEDKYSVKSEMLDNQHKKLIETINELYGAFVAGKHKQIIGEIIDQLQNYTKYHFIEEERLMQQMGIQLSDKHIKEHKEFIAKVENVRERYEKTKSSVTYGLMSFLRKWLTEHITQTDQEYKIEIEKRAHAKT